MEIKTLKSIDKSVYLKTVLYNPNNQNIGIASITDNKAGKKLNSLKELEKRTIEKVKFQNKKSRFSFEKEKVARANEKKILKVEKQISLIEREIKEIDFELEINYEQTIAQPNFFESYQLKKKELDFLMQEWENLQL